MFDEGSRVTYREPLDTEALARLPSVVASEPPLARQGVEAMLKDWPNSALLHSILSRLYLREKDLQSALVFASAAVCLDPRNPKDYKLVGGILRRLGHHDTATVVLEEGWELFKVRTMIVGDGTPEEREHFLAAE